jgi:xylulose-5-phosphate/fructose-6-phosphate phosphoketolase
MTVSTTSRPLTRDAAKAANTANTLTDTERALLDAYWRAANYLSVGQIYLYGNPLLKQPLVVNDLGELVH